MLSPSSILLSSYDSRYSLVVAVAKRARDIASEAEFKGEILIEKPVNMAIRDFNNHKFKIIPPKQVK